MHHSVRSINAEIVVELPEGTHTAQICWDRYGENEPPKFNYSALPGWMFNQAVREAINQSARELSACYEGCTFDPIV